MSEVARLTLGSSGIPRFGSGFPPPAASEFPAGLVAAAAQIGQRLGKCGRRRFRSRIRGNEWTWQIYPQFVGAGTVLVREGKPWVKAKCIDPEVLKQISQFAVQDLPPPSANDPSAESP